MDDSKKPNPLVRDAVIQEDVVLLDTAKINAMSVEELHKAEKYYEAFLEVLAGTQVWDILESLHQVEIKLSDKKKARDKYHS